MTVAATKTKAEQALSQNFEVVSSRLPGGSEMAKVRKAAIGTFAALGLPHRRIEEWKYTDLRTALKEALPPAIASEAKVDAKALDAALGALASIDACRVVFVDGVHAPELSSVGGTEGVEVGTLAASLATAGQRAEVALPRQEGRSHEAIVALNTAFMTDGAVVRITEGARLAKPLLLVLAQSAKEGRLATIRHLIDVGAGARASIIEARVALPGSAPGQANVLSQVTLGKGAHLAHAAVVLAGDAATHLATCVAALAENATYRAFHLTAATGLSRSTTFATFKGERAKLDISGLFLGRGKQHIDTTLVVDHAVPGCESRELFKGVLADEAHGVFQGKVIVRPDAQKSDGKQMAQVLMLSPDAEFDSKPELEIYADDVICGHGSTAADLDADLLFYLRARGIPPDEARGLLIESFIGEAIDKIEDESIREAIASLAKVRLAELSDTQSTGSGGRA
jgi:Fe-S cluster assembly protein SufD